MAFCLILLLLAPQNEITSENLDTVTVQDRFTEALDMYNSVRRNEAGPVFEEIVAELEAKPELNADERLIMTESLKHLAVIAYPDGTEAYFERLVRFAPDFEIDAKELPPKILEVFDELKGRLVGQIRVSAFDAGTGEALREAECYVDGRLVGPIYGPTELAALAGPRTLEIRKLNYEPYVVEAIIQPGAMIEVSGSLTRIAAEMTLVALPAGANVYLDGVLIGAADGEVPRDYQARLAGMGAELTDAGAISLDNLLLGDYEIAFEKPCYKTKKVNVTIDRLQLIYGAPVQLDPAGARLSVKTVGDASGIVFLNQERVGFLPVENHAVCPGEYTLRVKFTDGEFIKTLSVADGDVREVLAEPLPSIAWFGVRGLEEGPPPEDLDRWLRDLESWNLQAIDADDPGQIPIDPFPLLFAGPEMTEENSDILTRNLRADLYMAARIVRRKVVIRYLEVAFWTPLSKSVTVMPFDFRELDKLQAVLQAMDAFPPLTKPWLGAALARLEGVQGCKFLEVHPNGPLAGKVRPGEIASSLNGAVLRQPSEAIGLTELDPVRLEVDGRQVTVAPVATIAEVPFDRSRVAPQALLAKFEKLAKYHPDSLIRDSARFNQARFQFFLGDFKQAFDIFSTMTISADYGINQGTLYYYQGLCFQRLKLDAEARQSFRAVLDYPRATLFDAYGPKAAYWADTALNDGN